MQHSRQVDVQLKSCSAGICTSAVKGGPYSEHRGPRATLLQHHPSTACKPHASPWTDTLQWRGRTIRTLAVTEATLLRRRCCDHVATEGLGHAATCVHSPQDNLTHLQCAVRATLCSSITSCDHLNRCCTLSLHALAQCSYTQPPLHYRTRGGGPARCAVHA